MISVKLHLFVFREFNVTLHLDPNGILIKIYNLFSELVMKLGL